MSVAEFDERVLDVSLIQGGASAPIAIPESLQIMSDPDAVPPAGYGCIRVLTPMDGDRRVLFSSESPTQVADARGVFDALRNRGLRPFRPVNRLKRSEEFDGAAEETVFLPIALVVGG